MARSNVHRAHVRVTVAGGKALRCNFFDVLAPLGSRNRNYILSARVNPRQGQLTRGDAFLRGDPIHLLDHFDIALEVLALKPWIEPAKVVLRKVIEGLVLAAQKSPT